MVLKEIYLGVVVPETPHVDHRHRWATQSLLVDSFLRSFRLHIRNHPNIRHRL